MKLIERAEAVVKGLLYYYTGRPCKHGHVAKRQTKNGTCCACISLTGKRWYKKNKVRRDATAKFWYESNKVKRNASQKRWRGANLDKLALYTRNYRGRKRSASGRHTVENILALIEKQNGICAGLICFAAISKGYHVDHKTPLSRFGSNWPRNLQLLCPTCNISKGAKTQREWLRSLGL